MALENKVQSKILENLRLIKNSDWEKAIVTNKKGSADIKGDIHGWAVYIEAKRDDGKNGPDELQQYRIEKATQRGACAFWSDSWPHTYSNLCEFFNRKNIKLQLRQIKR